MKFKNVSNATLHLGPNRFVGPNEVFYASEEESKSFLFQTAITKNQIIEFIENVVEPIVESVLVNVIENVIKHDVNESDLSVEAVFDNDKDKHIQDAIHRAKINNVVSKYEDSNYDDEFDSEAYEMLDSKLEYGNIENSEFEPKTWSPYDGLQDTSSPSQALDLQVNKMVEENNAPPKMAKIPENTVSAQPPQKEVKNVSPKKKPVIKKSVTSKAKSTPTTKKG
jgi:hypothetical protein